jgi:hypothetical protein
MVRVGSKNVADNIPNVNIQYLNTVRFFHIKLLFVN